MYPRARIRGDTDQARNLEYLRRPRGAARFGGKVRELFSSYDSGNRQQRLLHGGLTSRHWRRYFANELALVCTRVSDVCRSLLARGATYSEQ